MVTEFAFDGSHKLYLLESEEDRQEALEADYEILPIEELKEVFESCNALRFVSNWKLTRKIVPQFA